MKNYIVLSLALSIYCVAFGMKEPSEKSELNAMQILKQARENSEAKKDSYTVDEQKQILHLAQQIDTMSKEETKTFIKSIEDHECRTIIQELCCLKNLYPTAINNIKTTDSDSPYYIKTTGKCGNLTFNMYHRKLPNIVVHTLNFNAFDVEDGTIKSNYIMAKILYERCQAIQCAWKIPTFEEYLKTKKHKQKPSRLAPIAQLLLPLKPLLTSLTAIQH